MSPESRELAIEELRILQSIIQHQVDIGFRIKSWCVTLVSLLSVALLSTDAGSGAEISPAVYVLGSTTLILLFMWLDAAHRVAGRRAKDRSAAVEQQIRTGQPYDGPLIGESIAIPTTVRHQLRDLAKVRLWGPYAVAFAVTCVVGLTAS